MKSRFTVDETNSTNVTCRIGFGAAVVPAAALAGANGILFESLGMDAKTIIGVGDGSGILGVGADGEDLRFTCEDPADGNLSITVSYYTVES